MACPPQRYANLPIAPKYKEALIAFCSSPDNAGACEQLCNASDEEIVATIEKMAPQLEQWEKEGVPNEIRNADPNLANELPQQQSMDDSVVSGGIGALPQPSSPPVNPSIPPGQLADVPMPMDVPSRPSSASSNVSYRNGGFVNAPSYGLGGLVGGISNALGGKSGLIGGIIGGALAFYTGGMSIAAGAALGAAAGTYADTGDLGLSARSGLTAYGMGTMAGGGATVGTTATVGGGATAATSAAPVGGMAGSTAAANAAPAAAAPAAAAPAAAAPSAANNFYKVAKIAGSLAQQGEQPQMAPPPPMPAPVQNKPVGPIRIPGAKQRRPTVNPQLSQGLGGLIPAQPVSGRSTPYASTINTREASMMNARTAYKPPQWNTNDSAESEMQAYYQCVMENGAEVCQMPDSMKNAQNTGNIEPAQYSQSFERGGAVNGLGTETSDSQPAWLSDNEFVMTADAVRGLGDGNVDEGANRMYNIMAQLEQRG